MHHPKIIFSVKKTLKKTIRGCRRNMRGEKKKDLETKWAEKVSQ